MPNEMRIRTRNWFLTINQEAFCYTNLKSILDGLKHKGYAYILHDKDNEEQPHYHCVLVLENARTFEQVQSLFGGAHIETVASLHQVINYLVHRNDKDKYQYEKTEVIQECNLFDYYYENEEHYKIDTADLLACIDNGDIHCFYDAVKRYGLRQASLYRNTINQLLEELHISKEKYEKEVRLNLHISKLKEFIQVQNGYLMRLTDMDADDYNELLNEYWEYL